jgi:hypothetical protein
MHMQLTIVSDAEFEALRATGDYKDSGAANSLTRVEGDVFYIVFRKSEYDRIEAIRAKVEAECAALERPEVSYRQFEQEASGLN